MFFPIALFIIYGAYYITNPVIVIFHELGHAFAYLVLTKPDKVDVFIGSYGDEDSKINFRVGKLHFHIKLSFPYIASGGMCRSSKMEANYIKEIIILLAGPLVTVIIAGIMGFVAFNTNVHGSVKFFCFALIIFAVISLGRNLMPGKVGGTNFKSDAARLVFTIRNRKVYTAYITALEALYNDEAAVSSEQLAVLANLHPQEEGFLRSLILSLLLRKDYDAAEIQFNNLKQIAEFETTDYINFGFIQTNRGHHQLAIENYQTALKLDPDNAIALNNLGYQLLLKGDYEECESVLNRAITQNPEGAFQYNNLGYLKILTGEFDAGRELVEKSLQLDADNAYAYRSMGVYHLKTGNKEQALINFNRAFTLKPGIDLSPYLDEAELV